MLLSKLFSQSVRALKKANCHNSYEEAIILVSHFLSLDRCRLITSSDKHIDRHLQRKINRAIKRRIMGEPIDYITGFQKFFGETYLCDKRALISRSETEQLVALVIPLIKELHLEKRRFLDIGTGSGIIAITLKKQFPQAKITATDISQPALNLAQENAKAHQVRINFMKSDLFRHLPKNKYDLIIANLPYVPSQYLPLISRQILDWEPQMAVEGGENGLKYLTPFLEQAREFWADKGVIALEIWHTHGKALTKIAQSYFPSSRISVKQDLANLDRFLLIER